MVVRTVGIWARLVRLCEEVLGVLEMAVCSSSSKGGKRARRMDGGGMLVGRRGEELVSSELDLVV